jgi:hypothetical protein
MIGKPKKNNILGNTARKDGGFLLVDEALTSPLFAVLAYLT